MTKHLSSSKARRLTLQGLLAAAAVGLGVTAVVTQIDQGNPVEAAQVEVETDQPPEGMDLALYSSAMQVRRAASLTDKDLAALDLSEAETTAVLNRLVSWCDSNQEAVNRSTQALNLAKREFNDQQRLVRIGQASERQMKDTDGKAQAVVDAEEAHAELLKGGAAYAMQAPELGAGKSNSWQRAAELKASTDSDLRYLSTMDTSRLEALDAEKKQKRVKEIEEGLTYGEQQELAAVRQKVNASMPGVRTAVESSMPLPVELQQPTEEALLDVLLREAKE